jgi:NAD(P)-dependent dehydrogenase (short-subunit alcohol dehydrogenase family)
MRTWFITGASSGLGKAFAVAALERGDQVVAAARGIARAGLDGGERLLTLPLDVTDRAAVFQAVDAAVQRFGHLDIVVNNAGTMAAGMVEEFTEEQARAQLEVNFFGALWVCQAVAPRLRAQRAGHLVQISSIAALGGFPTTGLYSASKFALEGLSEALAGELAPFGVKVSIVQPGITGPSSTTAWPPPPEIRRTRACAPRSSGSGPRARSTASPRSRRPR